MPFCVHCGHQVGDEDKFCAKCGTRQKGAAAPGAAFWDSISQRNAILFCYLPWIGWIMAVAILANAPYRNDRRVRFHAFQGLYLFVAWLMVDFVFGPMFGFAGWARALRFVPSLLHLAVLAGWIWMIVKAAHEEDYHLPVLGDLAERSAAEPL
jgi:uncharacterized membrane protein